MGIRSRLLGGGEASISHARRPEELAHRSADPPKEGLDWLGRDPRPEAPLLYRVLLGLGDAFLIRICRLRVEVEGREHLPAGGYLAICALHRSWVDPLVLIRALPLEPRVWFMGSGPTAFDRRWKERLLHRMGGILPVWRGGRDIEVHVRAARAVVEQGAVLGLFVEGAIAGPPAGLGRLRDGSALLALRTGAPVVPVAICGAEELYRGKRIRVRILAPVTVAGLLGPTTDALPPQGTRDELRVVHAITRALGDLLVAAVRDMHPATLDPVERPRRWAWLARLMR